MITEIARYSRRLALWLVAALVLVSGAAVAQDNRSVTVSFPRGATGTTISDRISGYQTVDYKLGVSAGQQMTVRLATDNASNYFNITAPGASEALFNGSVEGTSARFVVPSSGTYVIRVYLTRNAARRNERANFNLSFNVDGGAVATPVAPAPDFADGLQGGPDYWQVQGLSSGDTLNVRSGPGTGYGIIGKVRNGDTLRNFGCTMNGTTRWCQVQANGGPRGWVAGRYLHESFGNVTTPPATTLPAWPAQPIQVTPVAPQSVDTSMMPRYCAGEASAKYGVRPQDIVTNVAFQSGNRYVSQGWFDGAGGTTFFTCYFRADGTFLSIN